YRGCSGDWSSDVCSSDLELYMIARFGAKRFAAAAVVLAIVSVMIFSLVEVLPGDAATISGVGVVFEGGDPAQIETIRHEYGLDRPVVDRYWDWVTGLVQGDLGASLLSKRPVTAIIGDRLGNTLTLGAGALLL